MSTDLARRRCRDRFQGVDLGLEPDVHAFLKPGIERLARELDALR
ncbi:hypothetical protein [Burkholderia territorii]|nr:hypothetical protein [Burkholderia territorii]